MIRYSLINRVSVRYGSSAQYFWSGPQMFLQNLIDCENGPKQDQVTALGGAALAGGGAASAGGCSGATANVYLKLPHNSIRAAGKPLPFPSDLLVQPIVVTVELYALNAILIGQAANPATLAAAGPAALASAQLQVKQEMLTDSSDQLARRCDMNSHAYTFPLMYFAQQETQVQVTTSASSVTNTVNLTGFRAGEVKSVVLWLTPAATSSPATGAFNPLAWLNMNNVTLTYNGEIFARFDGSSAQLWNLAENEKLNSLPSYVTQNSGSTGTTAAPTYWIECPFAQVSKEWDRETKLIHGKPILNAVVSLQFDAPALSSSYVLHAMYIYNSSLLCSRGSAEYIF